MFGAWACGDGVEPGVRGTTDELEVFEAVRRGGIGGAGLVGQMYGIPAVLLPRFPMSAAYEAAPATGMFSFGLLASASSCDPHFLQRNLYRGFFSLHFSQMIISPPGKEMTKTRVNLKVLSGQ